jgi:hypothetical protein
MKHGAMCGIQQGFDSCSLRPSITSNISNGMQVLLIVGKLTSAMLSHVLPGKNRYS